MRARLFARYGPERGCEVELGREATIGRGRGNQVVLSSPEVSQQHARVAFDPESGRYYLEDLGSLNGTRLDGSPVRGRERLSGLHVLTFGESAELFFLELDRGPEEPDPAPAAAAGGTRVDAEAPTLPPGLRRPAASGTQVDHEAPTLPPGLRAESGPGVAAPPAPSRDEGDAAAAGRWMLVVELPGEPVRRFALADGDNLVGRTGSAAVRLEHRELSRRHAVVRVAGERVWVRDEGSRNKTFVDGEAIAGEVPLAAGAELRFGSLAARLVEATDD